MLTHHVNENHVKTGKKDYFQPIVKLIGEKISYANFSFLLIGELTPAFHISLSCESPSLTQLDYT